MTPIERAKYIIHSFVIVPDDALRKDSIAAWIDTKLAKQCAIICVEQIIEAFKQADGNPECTTIHIIHHWEEVLEHIKNS